LPTFLAVLPIRSKRPGLFAGSPSAIARGMEPNHSGNSNQKTNLVQRDTRIIPLEGSGFKITTHSSGYPSNAQPPAFPCLLHEKANNATSVIHARSSSPG
ncbi:MAG: hypothetical protein OEY28_04695, partial [Nitrospira sp.]|nr:hypothetical protein [Nitrospira sp.]